MVIGSYPSGVRVRDVLVVTIAYNVGGIIGVKSVRMDKQEKYYALFSGGKDSITLAHYLDSKKQLKGLVFIDTGISIPEVQEHVSKVCKEYHWPLIILRTPADYDALVVKYGFPGVDAHTMFMNYLKGRCVAMFRMQYRGEILASGVRSGESQRRMINTQKRGKWEGVKIVAPLYDWSTRRSTIGQLGGYGRISRSTICLSALHPRASISREIVCVVPSETRPSLNS